MNAGLAAAFIGIFTIFIVHIPTVEEDVALAGLKTGILSYHHLLEDLNLSQYGVIVPSHKNLTESRVFVPAGKLESIPDLYDEMSIVSSGKGKVGVSIVPPGEPLLEEAKNKMEYEIEGSDIEGGRECMGYLTQGMGLAKSFSLRKKGKEVKIRITLGRYDDFCEELRKKSTNICTRSGCPICSAYLTGASEAFFVPLKIKNFEKEDNHIKYDLEEI